jgi:hypothetical protein
MDVHAPPGRGGGESKAAEPLKAAVQFWSCDSASDRDDDGG